MGDHLGLLIDPCLESDPELKKRVCYRNIFGLDSGGTDVASMGSSYGVIGGEDLGVIYGKIWVIKLK